MKKKILTALLIVSMMLTSCETSAESNTPDNSVNTPADIVTADTTGLLQNSGAFDSVITDGCTEIDLSAAETSPIITEGGTYRLTGILNGQVIIKAKDAEVNLILDGASIYSADSAAIYVKKAASVTITLADGSVNTLENGGSYLMEDGDENNVDGAIFSKSDLYIGGSGTLNVIAASGHGIVSKDAIEIYSGTINLTSEKHGISAKDSIAVDGGSITVTSGHDGIHCENADDETLGFIYLKSGEMNISAGGDGISAAASLQIEDGTINIVSGGGAANGAVHTDNDMPRGGFRFTADSGNSDEKSESDTSDASTTSDSTKGLKAGGDIAISGGSITVDSADDSVHSNGNISITSGTLNLDTGDDGIHADGSLVIEDGSIVIGTSYEGLEGKTIDINGGKISLTASDDGINASAGSASDSNDFTSFFGKADNQFAAQEGVYIKITGGYLEINANGDGIDSNGDLIVSGGETYVEGPTSGGDGALDYNGSAVITGGIVIAAGSSGMAESFGDDSTQGSIITDTGSQSSGSVVRITAADETVLAEHTFNKQFENVVISCPGMAENGTYTLSAGSYSETITLDGITYKTSSAFGGFGGFGGGNRENGKPDGGSNTDMTPPDMPTGERPELPDGETPDFENGEMPDMPGGERPGLPGDFDSQNNGDGGNS